MLLASQALDVSAQECDSLVQTAFGTTAREDLLGGVSSVNVSELLKKDYYVNSLDDLSSLVS